MDDARTMDDLRRRLAAAEAALREREASDARVREQDERYRSLFQNMGQGYCDLGLIRDANGRAFNQIYLELNPAFERLFGVAVAQARGRTGHELFPDLEPAWYAAMDRVVRLGRPERIEYEFSAQGRWFEIFAYPRGGDRITALYEDITARKQAELVLNASQERRAFLLKLSDAIGPLADAVAIQEMAARLLGEHLGVSRALYAEFVEEDGAEIVVVAREHRTPEAPSFLGRHPAERFGPEVGVLRAGRIIAVPDTDTEETTEALREVWRSIGARARLGVPLVKDGRLVAGFGVQHVAPRPWSEGDIALVRETADRTWAAVERARAEAALRGSLLRQQILVHELQHRTRNLIAVVDGIARQTLDHTGPNARFIDQFNDRLIALARVQDLLARTDRRSVSIEDVVRLELDALGAPLAGVRVRVSGPWIRLRSGVIQTIALALHELATNARKYGAFTSPHGSLTVTWDTTEAEGRSWLSLDWVEEGVPSARPATATVSRGGYGRELIEEALPFALGARTTYSCDEAGVRCRIALPLDQVGKGDDDEEAE